MQRSNELFLIFLILIVISIILLIVLFRSYRKLRQINQDLIASWQQQNEYMDHNVEFCLKAQEISNQIAKAISSGMGASQDSAVLDECTELLEHIHGGSNVEEALIFDKKSKCEKLGISFIDKIGPLPNGRIREIDTVSLFGNLLDNAIEACQASGAESPFIRIETSVRKNGLIINISNSKDPKISTLDTEMKTTKANPEAHGLGMGIIRSIVTKYNGTIKMQDLGDTFESAIVVFMRNKPYKSRTQSKSENYIH